jgi:uncharacterized membrane protein (UPF0127 family)
MHMLRSLLALLGLILLVQPAPAQQPLQTFSKGELTIETASGPKKFTIELATTEQQREQGLMYRTRMAADAGMLFIYPGEQPIAMWMKNTYIPLDMVFIGADGTIRNIQERAVPQSLATIASDGLAKATLELNGGIVDKLGIKPGDKVIATGLNQ